MWGWGKYLTFPKHQASVSCLPRVLSQLGSSKFAGSSEAMTADSSGWGRRAEMMTPCSARHLPPGGLTKTSLPSSAGKSSLCRQTLSFPPMPFKGLFFHEQKDYWMCFCAWLKIPYSACLGCRRRANRRVLQEPPRGNSGSVVVPAIIPEQLI